MTEGMREGLIGLAEWRCINCKRITVAKDEPEQCSACWCHGLAPVAPLPIEKE